VANICYQGFHTTVAKTADAYDLLNQCTYHKKANSQAVAGGNNKHVEALKQDNAIHQPIYKKNVVNGHGERQRPPVAVRLHVDVVPRRHALN
jgi:hypothetical protein